MTDGYNDTTLDRDSLSMPPQSAPRNMRVVKMLTATGATTSTSQTTSISTKSSAEELTTIRLTWRTWLAVLVACIPILAQTFVTVAAGSVIAFIIRDLGNASLAGWVIQGPLLMQSVLSPLVGRLSDVLDRKWLVTLPPLIALAGAIISAKATSIAMLIAGGILIGCTLSTGSIVQSIPSEVLPLKYRALANGITFWAAGLGGISGTLGAGAVTNASPTGWRTLFWIQVGLHALSFLGLLLFYHPKRRSDYPRLPIKQFIWTLDPIGSVLFAASTTLILLALDWTGGTYAWSDAHVVAPLVIGLVMLIVFALYEWLGRDDGLVPHMFFRGTPNIAIALFVFGIEGWLFYSAINSVVPQIILNLGFEDNSWSIALRQLSTTIPTLFSCLVVTLYATKTKDLKTPLIVTWTIFLAVTIAYCFISPKQDAAQWVYSVLLAIGQSGPLTLVVAILQICSPHEYLSTATGLAFSSRAIGGAFGSAVLTAIVNGKLSSTYASNVGEAAVATGLPASSVKALVMAFLSGNLAAIESVPGIDPSILSAAMNASHWAYARAYRLAWASVVPFVVIALVAILFLKDVKAFMTDEIEATVEPSSEKQVEKGLVQVKSKGPLQTTKQM